MMLYGFGVKQPSIVLIGALQQQQQIMPVLIGTGIQERK
jgi:hypothetical protein